MYIQDESVLNLHYCCLPSKADLGETYELGSFNFLIFCAL